MLLNSYTERESMEKKTTEKSMKKLHRFKIDQEVVKSFANLNLPRSKKLSCIMIPTYTGPTQGFGRST